MWYAGNMRCQARRQTWLESHKCYPESARERDKEGSAGLRFRLIALVAG
jgi:hypothetical protein